MKLAGKHFCVSFSDGRDAKWCVANGQSVMFDNGAFTAFTQGKTFDMYSYYEWLEQWISHPHWAVIPDVIGGDIDEQRQLVNQWPFSKQIGALVWHMGLSIDWLLELADNWPRLCFGSSHQYWQVGNDEWCRRSDTAFNELAKHHKILPWIHLMRGMSLAGDRWPFASTDSANVARNFKSYDVCPERMARRLDSIQSPGIWKPKPVQSDFELVQSGYSQ
jgi:hypothetical protein